MLTYADVCGRMRTYADACAPYINAMRLTSKQSLPRAQHTSAYVSIRQHTSAYVSIDVSRKADVGSACVSIRQHTSAYVSMLTYAGVC
jgi:hypothetical protein